MKKIAFASIFAMSIFLTSISVHAQSRQMIEQQREYIEIESLLSKVENHLMTLPPNIRRLGLQHLNFKSSEIDANKIELIEARLADLITNTRNTRVISMSEFAQRRPIHVMGTDSTIIVTNSIEALRNQAGDTDWYQEIITKYQLDGILSGTMQYDKKLGYFLNVQLFDAVSREVVWSKSIYSTDVELGAILDRGKLWNIKVGATFTPVSNYRLTDIADSLWVPVDEDVKMSDYGITAVYRQPVGNEYSAMFGVIGGLHKLTVSYSGKDSVQFREYSKSVIEVGLGFYKTYRPKADNRHDFWIEAYLEGSLYFSVPERNLFLLKPGINANLTNNVGLSAYATYFLTPGEVKDTSEEVSFQLKNIGFGFSALFRF